MRRLGAAVLLFVVIRVAVAGSSSTGILEGQVQILRSGGANLSDDTSARKEKAPYSGAPLVVLSKDGKTEVSQILPDSDGRFHVNLPAGDYVLRLKQHGRGRLRAEARPFTIVAGQTVRVDMTVESAVPPM